MEQKARIRYFIAFSLLISTMLSFIMTDLATCERNPTQLNRIYLFMDEGMSLSPIPPDDPTGETLFIPDGFVGDGFGGYGILPVGSVEWREVGTWSSVRLSESILLGGKATFTIWAYNKGNATTSDFEFQICKRAEENPLVMIRVDNIRISGDPTVPTKVSGSVNFPPGNDTSIESGGSIELKLRARCNGGATLLFGTDEYPSGVEFNTNSLVISSIEYYDERLSFQYTDAFRAPWTRLTIQFVIDGIPLDNEGYTTEMDNLNQTRWITVENVRMNDDFNVLVKISYGQVNCDCIEAEKKIEIDDEKEEEVQLLTSLRLPIVFISVIMTLFILVIITNKEEE